jgi:hypothetical protein
VFARDVAGQFGPAKSVTIRGSDLVLSVNRTTVNPGASATWTAVLRDAGSGAPVPGEDIVFMGRKAGSRTWSTLDVVATSGNGVAALMFVPTVAVQVQAFYYGGNARFGTTAGPLLTTLGRRATATAVDATLTRGSTLVVRGRVAPATATVVTLQRYYGGAWKSVAKVTSRGDGVYSVQRTVSSTGKQRYRVWVAAKGPFLAGASSDVWVTVR